MPPSGNGANAWLALGSDVHRSLIGWIGDLPATKVRGDHIVPLDLATTAHRSGSGVLSPGASTTPVPEPEVAFSQYGISIRPYVPNFHHQYHLEFPAMRTARQAGNIGYRRHVSPPRPEPSIPVSNIGADSRIRSWLPSRMATGAADLLISDEYTIASGRGSTAQVGRFPLPVCRPQNIGDHRPNGSPPHRGSPANGSTGNPCSINWCPWFPRICKNRLAASTVARLRCGDKRSNWSTRPSKRS